VDDLRQVKGIGEKTLDRNRDAIRLSGGAKAASAAAKAEKPAHAARSRRQ